MSNHSTSSKHHVTVSYYGEGILVGASDEYMLRFIGRKIINKVNKGLHPYLSMKKCISEPIDLPEFYFGHLCEKLDRYIINGRRPNHTPLDYILGIESPTDLQTICGVTEIKRYFESKDVMAIAKLPLLLKYNTKEETMSVEFNYECYIKGTEVHDFRNYNFK